MGETTTGFRGALARPGLYSALQRLLGAEEVRNTFLSTYLKPVEGERLLDLGCGPGDLLAHLPPAIDYVGVDLSPAYIDAARTRFGDRGRFVAHDARAISRDAFGRFEVVVSIGLLHHLDDPDVIRMLRAAQGMLRAGGRFLSLDPAWAAGQPRSARWLMKRDRGGNIRSPDGYRRLVGRCFQPVTVSVHHDLARVPYTHAVIEGRAPGPVAQSNSE